MEKSGNIGIKGKIRKVGIIEKIGETMVNRDIRQYMDRKWGYRGFRE